MHEVIKLSIKLGVVTLICVSLIGLAVVIEGQREKANCTEETGRRVRRWIRRALGRVSKAHTELKSQKCIKAFHLLGLAMDDFQTLESLYPKDFLYEASMHSEIQHSEVSKQMRQLSLECFQIKRQLGISVPTPPASTFGSQTEQGGERTAGTQTREGGTQVARKEDNENGGADSARAQWEEWVEITQMLYQESRKQGQAIVTEASSKIIKSSAPTAIRYSPAQSHPAIVAIDE